MSPSRRRVGYDSGVVESGSIAIGCPLIEAVPESNKHENAVTRK